MCCNINAINLTHIGVMQVILHCEGKFNNHSIKLCLYCLYCITSIRYRRKNIIIIFNSTLIQKTTIFDYVSNGETSNVSVKTETTEWKRFSRSGHLRKYPHSKIYRVSSELHYEVEKSSCYAMFLALNYGSISVIIQWKFRLWIELRMIKTFFLRAHSFLKLSEQRWRQ